MSEPEIIYLQASGGGRVRPHSMPLPEALRYQLAKGEVRRVTKDGDVLAGEPTPVQTEEVADDPRDLEIARLRAELEAALEPKSGPPAEPVDDEPERPADSALKGDWVAYALHVDKALSADDAEAMTKADLIELYGSK
jgi:hypothetical protein